MGAIDNSVSNCTVCEFEELVTELKMASANHGAPRDMCIWSVFLDWRLLHLTKEQIGLTE